MKLTLGLILTFIFSAFTNLHVDSYNVDQKQSKIEWFAEKVTGKHNGTIALSGGTVQNNHGKLTGTFTFNMQSISVSDLEGDKKTKLENHLKSDDFFASSKYPFCSFVITSVTPKPNSQAGEPNFDVVGSLTIKDSTKEITFPALIKFEPAQLTAKAEVIVNRADFDIRYGSKTFFEDIGDRAIYDEFRLKLDLVAIKS